MRGIKSIFWKELSDLLGSRRFVVITLIILITSLFVTYSAIHAPQGQEGVGGTPFLNLFCQGGNGLPSFLFFVTFFGPLMGILFGFDSISGEKNRGTLSLLVSQPIYRDSVINGKFLAGIAATGLMISSIMVIITGMSIAGLGIVPTGSEAARTVLFFLAAMLYISFWLSLAILASVCLDKSTTAALYSIGAWLFLSFFLYMAVGVAVDRIVPLTQSSTTQELLRHARLQSTLMRFSPAILLQEISMTILNPSVRILGPVLPSQLQGFIPTPLPLGQSLLVIWPQFVALIALSCLCFTLSYISFMRREIRN